MLVALATARRSTIVVVSAQFSLVLYRPHKTPAGAGWVQNFVTQKA